MTQIEIVTKELKKRGINQKDFCNDLEIGQSTFSTWKVRNTTIPAKYITRIANYFNWPVDVLFNADEFQECESNSEQFNYCVFDGETTLSIEQEVFSKLRKLPLKEKLQIMLEITTKADEIESGGADQ